MRKIIVFALLILIAGCGSPKIDASSDEAFKESIAAVRESLQGKDREEFDAFVQEIIVGVAFASVFTKDTLPISSVMQSYDGLSGKEFITKAKKAEADRTAKAKKAEAERAAKERADDLAKLAELKGKSQAAKAELKKLANIKIENAVVSKIKRSYMSDFELFATVTNDLSTPLARISFEYSLKSPERAVPWTDGKGFFFIDGGLEPRETRKLKAAKSGFSMGGFILLYNAMQEHKEAVLAIKVTDGSGPDGNSILKVASLSGREVAQLEKLREQFESDDGAVQ